MSRLLALYLTLTAALAAAHGRAAFTVSIAPHPSDGRVLVGTTYGILLSDSAGAFDWICTPAVGYEDLFDPKLLWAKDGTMFAAIPGTKLARSTDGCTWTDIAAFSTTGAADLIEDPTVPGTYWATTAKYGGANGVFKSIDGVNFTATALSRTNTYFSGVAVAPSNGQRLYATAWYGDPLARWLFRSDDRGQTFTELTPTLPAESQSGFKVLGVHPTDADVLFASIYGGGGFQMLLRSSDAGATWSTLFTTDDIIRTLFISSDGVTAYVATARKMFLSTDSGATFAETAPWVTNACIAGRDSELWTCGREPANAFIVGRFSLANTTIATVLDRNEHVRGPLNCAAGTTVGDVCPAQWPLTAAALGVPLTKVDAGSGGGDAGGGGGSGGGRAAPEQPCGCSGGRGALGLASLVVALARRRRKS